MAIASEIMTSVVVTAKAETTAADVARLLLEHGFGGVPVVSDGGSLDGMVSGFDVISKHGETVGDIMSRGVVWVAPSDSFAAVVELMGLHGIRRVPVVEDGQLVGIISRSDLLRHWSSLQHD